MTKFTEVTDAAGKRKAFERYLRTGQRFQVDEPKIEAKFNPWHDPDDGRFTFSGRGNYVGVGHSAAETSSQNARFARRPTSAVAHRRLEVSRQTGRQAQQSPLDEARDPKNYTVYVVERGDSLSHIAKNRKGLSPASLALINGISVEGVLRVGQKLKVPTQVWLDFNKERHNRALRAAYYVAMGGNLPIPSSPGDKSPQVDLTKLPSIEEQIASSLKTFSANGYTFVANDLLGRSHRATGKLQFGVTAARSPSVQASAGGEDRRATDHGGHFIAVRFNGPAKWYNHFAQDADFNNRAYRKLENEWDRKGKTGQDISVDIYAHYRERSRRPYEIEVRWKVDDKSFRQKFPNEAGDR